MNEFEREKARLDWVILHSHGLIIDSTPRGSHVVAWISQGAPGNVHGPSGRRVANGNDARECIDKFLRGEIERM